MPELPFVDDVMKIATADLDASRATQQRLLTIGTTLLTVAATLAGLFAGLAASTKNGSFMAFAVPAVLALGYLDGVARAHFRRISARITVLELLVHYYVSALRELGVSRAHAVRRLRSAVDQYQFGVERSFERVGVANYWRVNRTTLEWWLFPALALLLATSSAFAFRPADEVICIRSKGGIARVEAFREVRSGTVEIVPCASSASTNPTSTDPTTTTASTVPTVTTASGSATTTTTRAGTTVMTQSPRTTP